jgi:hypothetical protein
MSRLVPFSAALAAAGLALVFATARLAAGAVEEPAATPPRAQAAAPDAGPRPAADPAGPLDPAARR